MFDSQMQRPQDLKAIAERQQDLTGATRPIGSSRRRTSNGVPLTHAGPRQRAYAVPHPTVCQPSLGFVVQGRKRALLNEEVFYYDALNYLVVSVTLPMMGQVLEATSERPFLCLRMDLDLEEIARLLLELGDRGAAPLAPDRGLFVARMDESLLDAVLRMVKLLDTPEDIAVLAPAVRREIYYRVLRGELGQRLVDLAECDGGNHRIVRAIEWLKQHFTAPLRIEELAEAVHMSPSALHHRFKAVTAIVAAAVPEASAAARSAAADVRRGALNAPPAGHRVGYESPSQFSREYRRLFGAPPRIEIARLREIGIDA